MTGRACTHRDENLRPVYSEGGAQIGFHCLCGYALGFGDLCIDCQAVTALGGEHRVVCSKCKRYRVCSVRQICYSCTVIEMRPCAFCGVEYSITRRTMRTKGCSSKCNKKIKRRTELETQQRNILTMAVGPKQAKLLRRVQRSLARLKASSGKTSPPPDEPSP